MSALEGLSVLIVEDEVIIAMMLLNEIERAGGTPIGPATTVAEALKEIRSSVIDVALVDGKLADGWAADLVAALRAHAIPYIVVSGYEATALPAALKDAPFVAKPISLPLLFDAIAAAAGQSSRSTVATPPHSDGEVAR